MQDEAKRVTDSFQPLFDNGLMDIKFFVPRPEASSLSDVLDEAVKIQNAKTRVLDSFDADWPRTSFDAPF